jgi:hypothetical protein
MGRGMKDEDCRICLHKRLRAGLPPQKKYRVAQRVTDHSVFNKRRGAPLFLCPICDGEALENSIKEHSLRLASH